MRGKKKKELAAVLEMEVHDDELLDVGGGDVTDKYVSASRWLRECVPLVKVELRGGMAPKVAAKILRNLAKMAEANYGWEGGPEGPMFQAPMVM